MSENNRNWYELNFDISKALKSKQKIFDLKEQDFVKKLDVSVWTFKHDEVTEHFTDEWIAYMSKHGLEFEVAFVICRKKGASKTAAHVDCLSNIKDIYSIAINWVLNDNSESYHAWYRAPDDMPEPPMWSADHYKGHSLIDYDDVEKLTEIDRCYIRQNPVLVRTDIPHNIVQNDLRWGISVRFKVLGYVPKDGKNLTWEEQVNILKPFIVV